MSARRPSPWGAVGATLGLVALVALATAAAPAKKKGRNPKPSVPDSTQVLATVGGQKITRADVDHRLAELPAQIRANFTTPDGRRQLLNRVIEEHVWMIEAKREGIADRPEVEAQLRAQRRDLIIRTFLNELMAKNPMPSDSEARAYYDSHADQFHTPASVSLSQVQTRTEADAKRVLREARRGVDWKTLVKKYSTDSLSRARDGALGTVTKDGEFATLGAQPALAESAMALGSGKIGGPYRTNHGWHVIKVTDMRPESQRSFELARPAILRQLSSQHSQTFYQEQLEKARKDLGVKPDSAAIRDFISQRKTPRELFQEAQALGPAESRIRAYRHLLEQYPDADVSPQAQFMIGFIQSEELKKYDDAEKSFRALLDRFPKSELAPSARWMIAHMRTEDAPPFMTAGADSGAGAAKPAARPKEAPSR